MESLFGNKNSGASPKNMKDKDMPRILKKFKRNPNHSYVYLSKHLIVKFVLTKNSLLCVSEKLQIRQKSFE